MMTMTMMYVIRRGVTGLAAAAAAKCIYGDGIHDNVPVVKSWICF